MPKRKSNPCATPTAGGPSISSFDAALDLLACDTFSRLDNLTKQFEKAVGMKLEDGVARKRWEEAVLRYGVMKDMDGLCCGKMASGRGSADENEGEVKMEDGEEGDAESMDQRKDGAGRPLPDTVHPGAAALHSLCPDEEREWRRWTPKVGDVVLVDTEGGIWPGKIIDRRVFFQGRTIPRGNHFFPVRIYNEAMPPTIVVKARLLPFHLRKPPPLLASESLLGAYHHATNPATFDTLASARESLAAHNRTHPGVGEETDRARIKAEKEEWNELVNWVMNERRIEKLRVLGEERERRLKEVTKNDGFADGIEDSSSVNGLGEIELDLLPKRRRMVATVPLPPTDGRPVNGRHVRSTSPCATIFGPHANSSCSTAQRTSSPSLASFIRPALSTPQRPSSPRRFDKKRNAIYGAMGEWSPRGRGRTYTPPRILPSGDETAPAAQASPVPSRPRFDFVGPLGPVKLGRPSDGPDDPVVPRSESRPLEAVKEEADEEDGWTTVHRRKQRGGSAPCREKAREMGQVAVRGQDENMDL